jgi:hypothetical protein
MVDDTRAARAYVAPLRAQLTEPGARCPKRVGLELIGHVERLATIIEARQAELPELLFTRDRYAALVTDYIDAARQMRPLSELRAWADWRARQQPAKKPKRRPRDLAARPQRREAA